MLRGGARVSPFEYPPPRNFQKTENNPHMQYTFQATIGGEPGAIGSIRIGTIGGSPDVEVQGLKQVVGLNIPPRYGMLQIRPVDNNTDILACTATVYGYNSRPIIDFRLPGSVQVELPVAVTITGPVGTAFIVEAWPTYAGGNERGAAKSFSEGGGNTPVPIWATTFDFSSITPVGEIEFFDASAASIGIVVGNVSNFSVPDGAATFTLTTNDGGFVVFRQQG